MLINLLTGMLIGFLIAVPIGPIDMLCIRKTLINGPRSGFITGMGAAFADGIYGTTAAFSIMTLTTFLMSYRVALQLLGGLFLCCLGFSSFFKKKLSTPEGITTNSLALAFLTTFFLALMSPMTILSFVGAFAVLGIGLEGAAFEAPLMLSLGVFFGSSLWWFILSCGVAIFKHKFNISDMQWINRISGAVLLSFGFMAIGLAIPHVDIVKNHFSVGTALLYNSPPS